MRHGGAVLSDAISLRFATADDAPVVARHRVAMFRDMGTAHADARLEAESSEHLARALASGDYVGWLASPSAAPGEIVGGGGVLLRPFLPRPNPAGGAPLAGREALVMNVYTVPAWRRRGVARRLMEAILAWAPTAGVVNVVLHASDEGRPLYESLGFVATNEMRYDGRSMDEARNTCT